MEKIIQSLLLVVALAFSVDGHYQHIQYLKEDHSDDAETVPDRPGFTGEWEINGTTPWAFPENEIANQRNFVESSGGRCAFRSQSQNDEKVFEEAFNRWKAAIKNGKNTGWFNGRRLKTLVIPTYVHVLTDGKKGDVSEQMIDDQIQVLNDAFEEAGFHFLLMKQNGKSASRTSNKKWHQGKDEYKYKARLRKGGKNALNIYVNQAKGYLGYAYYPSKAMAGSVLDGVVVFYRSLPGGGLFPYHLGDTLVHEAGHWLNLPHTFANGCKSPGDFVDDTPFEREPAFGCPIGRDTCKGPGYDGLDPIHNYMDYADDACMDHFTAGQIERMFASYDLYRDPGLDDGEDENEGEDEDEDEVTPAPTSQPSTGPSASPVASCGASGSLCRKKNECCSNKCKKEKESKLKKCR